MKKSTLLTLLTSASIIITTAGTYAVWDTLEGSTSEAITFRNPVTIEVSPDYELTEVKTLGVDPTASGDITFTIKDDNSLATKLTIVPTVEGSGVTIDNFDFEITDKNGGGGTLTGDKTSGFVDSSLDSTVYTVKVIPKDNTVAGKEATIKLTATLE